MADIKCTDCGRWLGSTEKSVNVTLKCSNSKCKSLKNYNIKLASELEIEE